MVNVVSVAIERGYLNVPEGMIIEANEVKNYRSRKGGYSLYW